MYWKDKKQAQVVRSLAKSQEEEADWIQVPSAPTAVVFSSLAPPLRCQDGHFSLSSTWESQSLVVSEVHADLVAMGRDRWRPETLSQSNQPSFLGIVVSEVHAGFVAMGRDRWRPETLSQSNQPSLLGMARRKPRPVRTGTSLKISSPISRASW